MPSIVGATVAMKNSKILELLVLSLIIVLSLYPRLWHLETTPRMIVDEPANLRDIQKILQKPSGFYPGDFEWGFGQATLVHYPTIILAKLMRTAPNLLVLRLSSVLLSLAALIPFYFLVKFYTTKVIALCSTLLFSFNYFYLQFSRVGWTNMFVIFSGLFYIFFLQLALQKKSVFWFVLAGFAGGVILYGYRGGQVYLLAGFAYLLYHLATRYNFNQVPLRVAVFLGCTFLVSAPWLFRITNNWELYNLRQRVVNVFNANRPYHGFWKNDDILRYQIFTTTKSWILLEAVDGGGIENLRYLPLRDPPVNPVIRFLFMIGLILAIIKFKKTFIWLIVFFLGLLFGQLLTVDPPNGSRALVFLPVIYLFSALTVEKFYQLTGRKHLFLIVTVIISGILIYYDFSYYQYWMSWIPV